MTMISGISSNVTTSLVIGLTRGLHRTTLVTDVAVSGNTR